jgi:Flp pilus assembly protein TadD
LGVILTYDGDYADAVKAYNQGLKYGISSQIIDNLAQLTLVYGSPKDNEVWLAHQLQQHTQDQNLWIYYAILQQRYFNKQYAKIAISYAEQLGPVPDAISSGINNDKTFTYQLGGILVTIE